MKIKCNNCGKRIPFSGKVCPWCKADKSQEKAGYVFALLGALLLSIVVGSFGGFVAAFIGGLVGATIGYVVGLVYADKRASRR